MLVRNANFTPKIFQGVLGQEDEVISRVINYKKDSP